MIQPQTIKDRIQKMRDYLKKLKQLAQLNKDDFLSDFRNIESSKYLLQVSIECCLDMANHIIASEKLRSPKDYADSFRVLHENAVVPDGLIKNLVEMTKFRNRLVHIYWEIHDELIYEIIQEHLNDFDHFIQSVLSKFDLS